MQLNALSRLTNWYLGAKSCDKNKKNYHHSTIGIYESKYPRGALSINPPAGLLGIEE